MKKAETKFKEKVLARLKEIPNSWVVKIQQVVIRGTPDILMCIRGKFIAIELKTDDGELDELQAFNLLSIQNAGGEALVMTPENCFQVLHYLKEIK